MVEPAVRRGMGVGAEGEDRSGKERPVCFAPSNGSDRVVCARLL